MKNRIALFPALLIIFIGIIIGIVIGRQTRNDDIAISYQTGIARNSDTSTDTSQGPAVDNEDIGKININTASLSLLMTLPDIGEVIAQRIIDYRTQNGNFQSIDELLLVEGIGAARLEKIRDEITVGG